jgi:hypothetical protein
MLYGAGNKGKTVVYKHFLDENDKNNAKHIAREVQEFLTASHITNVVAGMFALCRAFAHISAAALLCRHSLCLFVMPMPPQAHLTISHRE